MGADDSTWGIAAQRWEELRKFRATHQSKHFTVRGVNWNYIVSGEGGEALVLLPGGAMVGSPSSRASRPLRIATGSSRRTILTCLYGTRLRRSTHPPPRLHVLLKTRV